MAVATPAEVRARPIRAVEFEPLPVPGGMPRRSLIPIKPSGTGPPVFLVHGILGQIFHFKRLAERIREDIPLYGLEARGLRDDSDARSAIEEMAAAYIKEIREFQPEGPYLIGGFSLGAAIAWSMAQQLDEAGETVRLLTIDHGPPMDPLVQGRFERLRRLYSFHWRNWKGLEGRARSSYRRTAFRDETQRLLGFLHLNDTGFFYRLTLKVGRQPEAGQVKVLRGLQKAMADWEWTPYPHSFTLFRAKIHGPQTPKNTALGYTPEFAVGGVDVVDVPGSHAFSFVEPHVNTLAVEFEAWFDRQVALNAEMLESSEGGGRE